MQQTAQLLAIAAALSTASAGSTQGFNYGSMNVDNTARMQTDFETSFKTAKNLVGTDDAFTSARLYTMIQAYSTADVISAIPAAISTKTSLLLGLWASGTGFANEITALKAAIETYGSELGDLCIGISCGSEDLYRNGATSIKNGGGIGQDPATLISYINEIRNTIKGTALANCPVGHVDTWDAYTNGSNTAVIDELDWVGLDTYPFWQYSDGNDVNNGAKLFQTAYDATKNVIGGKEIWITETGWAVSGKTQGEAIAGTSESKTYWDAVGCEMLFGKINTWWYTLTETGASPDFGVSNSDSNTTPLYDLSCSNVSSSSSTTSSAASGTATATATGTGAASVSTATEPPSSGSGSGSGSSGSNGTTNNNYTATATATATATGTSTSTGTSTASSSTSTVSESSDASANMVSVGGLLAAVAFVFAL